MITFAEFCVLVCFLRNVVWFSDIYFASTSLINYNYKRHYKMPFHCYCITFTGNIGLYF